MKKILGTTAVALLAALPTAAYASMSAGQFGGSTNGVIFQVNTSNSRGFWANSVATGGATVSGNYRTYARCDYQPTRQGDFAYITRGSKVSRVSLGACTWGIASGKIQQQG
ncbi:MULTISPECIES: hypothetical protein [unclassified Actinotignum]|uniref:hypothetical protein n=1 Tax=unclassified Actinotignum TaxID=2632702 RepID=UPI003F44C355